MAGTVLVRLRAIGRLPGSNEAANATAVDGTRWYELADELTARSQVVRGAWMLRIDLETVDAALSAAVMRGEHVISGFRDRKIREALYGTTNDRAEAPEHRADRVVRHSIR